MNRRRRMRTAVTVLLVLSLGMLSPTPAAASASLWNATPSARGPEHSGLWLWPLAGPRIVAEPYRAPAQPWASGHRGIDLPAPLGSEVRSPAAGVIAFRGTVVDRPLITIRHAGGLVTTVEPLNSELSPGYAVAAGEVLGVAASGGHTKPGTLHLGVRWNGDYINPMLLFGGVPRAVLLPCCERIH